RLTPVREIGRSSAGRASAARPLSLHAGARTRYSTSSANGVASSPACAFSRGISRAPSGDCPGLTGLPAGDAPQTTAPCGSAIFTKLRWLFADRISRFHELLAVARRQHAIPRLFHIRGEDGLLFVARDLNLKRTVGSGRSAGLQVKRDQRRRL